MMAMSPLGAHSTYVQTPLAYHQANKSDHLSKGGALSPDGCIEGMDGHAQATEFSEQSSILEAMLGSQKRKQKQQHQKMKVISSIDDGSSVNSQGGTKVVVDSSREKVVVPVRLAPMH